MRTSKGFTLVEAVVTIVIIGIFLTSGISVFVNSGKGNVMNENITVAQSLAEGKMEQVMANSYAAIAAQAVTAYAGNLSQFSSQVVVDYVTQANLDTVSGTDSGYKRIRVIISSAGIPSPIQIESIRANY